MPREKAKLPASTTAKVEDSISPPPLQRRNKRTSTAANGYANDANEADASTPKKRAKTERAAKTTKNLKDESDGDDGDTIPPKTSTPKRSPKKATKQTPNPAPAPAASTPTLEDTPEGQDGEVKAAAAKPKATRAPKKTAEQKAAEAMPLAARTVPSALSIGAHVSGAGGVHNVIPNALHIGANSLACFLKSQRKWANPDLKDEHADAFAHACKTHSYNPGKTIVPHGSYLVNLAAQEKDKADQAYASFLDDLQRCDRLGIGLYNFHPGNTNGKPRAEAIARLAAQLNRAHKATHSVVTLLENMAAAPTANTIGGTFEDLRDVIALVDDKARVGVCIDTCHAFAAGYDLRSPAAYSATMAAFDGVVGAHYLRAVHLNDSKGVLRSHRDLHQNIGLGFLGLRAFHNIVNDKRFDGVPMVLETPIDAQDPKHPGDPKKTIEDRSVWAREIKLLESLRGMDAESDEFKALEAELQTKGALERKKLQDQFDRKEKDGSGKKKGKKGKGRDTSDEESE